MTNEIIFKKLKNPQGVFSREKSAKQFGVIRSLQLAETGPVAFELQKSLRKTLIFLTCFLTQPPKTDVVISFRL